MSASHSARCHRTCPELRYKFKTLAVQIDSGGFWWTFRGHSWGSGTRSASDGVTEPLDDREKKIVYGLFFLRISAEKSVKLLSDGIWQYSGASGGTGQPSGNHLATWGHFRYSMPDLIPPVRCPDAARRVPEAPDACTKLTRVLPEYSDLEITHTEESRPMFGRITRIAAEAC